MSDKNPSQLVMTMCWEHQELYDFYEHRLTELETERDQLEAKNNELDRVVTRQRRVIASMRGERITSKIWQ